MEDPTITATKKDPKKAGKADPKAAGKGPAKPGVGAQKVQDEVLTVTQLSW